MKCYELIPGYKCSSCNDPFYGCAAEGIANYLDDVLYDCPLRDQEDETREEWFVNYVNGMTLKGQIDIVLAALLKLPKYRILSQVLLLQ